MQYLEHCIRKRIFPIVATVGFLLLLMHKSEVPAVLGRYSVDYTILLFLYGFNVALLWWGSVLEVSYKSLRGGISSDLVLSFFLVFVSMIFVVDLVGMRNVSIGKMIKTPSDWAILTLLVGLLMQLEVFGKRTIIVCRDLALLGCSLVVTVVLLEAVFVLFLVESRTPKNQREFVEVMSSQGLWSEPIPVKKPAGTFRILGLSDSFGTAGGVSSNYHYVLEDILRREVSRKIQIVNVSVPAYEPRHQLAILRFAMAYDPDVVLHGFFVGNDFTLYGGDMYEYLGIPVKRGSDGSPYRPRNFLLRGWVENGFKFLAEKRRRDDEKLNGAVSRLGSFSQRRFLEIQFERIGHWAKKEDRNTERMKNVLPVLDAIRSAVEQNGTRYVMVIHPDETQVNAQLRQEIVRSFQMKQEDYDFDLPQRLLSSYCEDKQLACLDLLPVFRREAENRDLYLLRDTHYNDVGNKLAAGAIGKFMQDKQLLPRIARATDVHLEDAN